MRNPPIPRGMISALFVSPAEIAAAQQAAERERLWCQARALGATPDDIEKFDAAVIAHAQRRPGSNRETWAAWWQQAIEDLKRGEGLPEVPE
jgi:hypothetical protein